MKCNYLFHKYELQEKAIRDYNSCKYKKGDVIYKANKGILR